MRMNTGAQRFRPDDAFRFTAAGFGSFEPPRLFATRAIRGPRIETRFTLEPLETGTRVDVQVSGEVPGGALGARLAAGFLRKELTASLDRLRELGESRSDC